MSYSVNVSSVFDNLIVSVVHPVMKLLLLFTHTLLSLKFTVCGCQNITIISTIELNLNFKVNHTYISLPDIILIYQPTEILITDTLKKKTNSTGGKES